MCAANIILRLPIQGECDGNTDPLLRRLQSLCLLRSASSAVSTDERLSPLSSFLYFSSFLFVFVLSRAGQVEVEHWFRVITRDPLITEPGKTKQDRALYPRQQPHPNAICGYEQNIRKILRKKPSILRASGSTKRWQRIQNHHLCSFAHPSHDLTHFSSLVVSIQPTIQLPP